MRQQAVSRPNHYHIPGYPAGRGQVAVLETPDELIAPAIVWENPRHVKLIRQQKETREETFGTVCSTTEEANLISPA
jgi:hypothetical protein